MKNTCLIKLWDWVTHKISDLCVINLLIMHVSNYKMESYCLKCKKKPENIDLEISSTSNTEQWYYQSAQYVVVKNPDLLKTKKQKDY